jgi:hypothetical protein
MSSRNLREKGYSQPSAAGEEDKSVIGNERLGRKRRQASVYDAVAGMWHSIPFQDDIIKLVLFTIYPGRVTTTLALIQPDSPRPHARHHRRHAVESTRDPTLAPEEVLFKRAGAPVRYAEKDIYQAHADLPDGGQGVLPDSDLLKTIHSYASHFYKDFPANRRTARNDGIDGGSDGVGEGISERSMDETALLAFGILLEEASREALGHRGDLVFTEGMEIGEEDDEREDGHRNRRIEPSKAAPGEAEVHYGFNDALRYQQVRQGRLKRRRRASPLSTEV